MKELFSKLRDTVVITDRYGYILEINRGDVFPRLKKGKRLDRLMDIRLAEGEDEYRDSGRVYRRRVSDIRENGETVGYAVMLSDITEQARLLEINREKQRELEESVREREKTNAMLKEYSRRAESLAESENRLRLARRIHDEIGHTVTELHAVSQMCLDLKGKDPERYRDMLAEGITLCDRTLDPEVGNRKVGESPEAILAAFAGECLIPVEWQAEGKASDLFPGAPALIRRICSEAYHNVLDHSLGDRMFVCLSASESGTALRIEDNGSFRGRLEKGFGLTTMEESVKASGGEIAFIAEPGRGFGIRVDWKAKDKEEGL